MKFSVVCLNDIFDDALKSDFFSMKVLFLRKMPFEAAYKQKVVWKPYFRFQTTFWLFQFKPIKRFYFFIASVKVLTL